MALLDTALHSSPIDGPLYVQCVCDAPLRLTAANAWTLCPCGRAVKFVGQFYVVENAEQWARSQP